MTVSGVTFLDYPDLFIIGAMKSGTTTLNKLLTDNPLICGEGEKEKHFFDKSTYISEYQKAHDKYEAEFQDCKKNQLTIDASPDYINTEVVPERIYESYPPAAFDKKRFILILREPIARHFSEYQMRLRVCIDNQPSAEEEKPKSKSKMSAKDLEEAEYRAERLVRNCKQIAYNFYPGVPLSSLKLMTFFEYIHSPWGKKEVSRGHFKQHIANWLKFMRRDQMYIVNFSTLIKNTTAVYDGILGFIGLTPPSRTAPGAHPVRLPDPGYKGKNHSYDSFAYLDCPSYERLSRYYSKINAGLLEYINKGSGNRSRFEPDFQPFSPYPCVGKRGPNEDDFMAGGEDEYDGN